VEFECTAQDVLLGGALNNTIAFIEQCITMAQFKAVDTTSYLARIERNKQHITQLQQERKQILSTKQKLVFTNTSSGTTKHFNEEDQKPICADIVVEQEQPPKRLLTKKLSWSSDLTFGKSVHYNPV